MKQHVLIAGASIAGLTAAHWLARAGFAVTVAERTDGPRPGGNGVDLRARAAEVIELMGLTDRVRAAATDVIGMKFVDAAGRARARIDTRVPGAVEIMRGDLVGLLASTVENSSDVEFRFGSPVRALDQDGTGVSVTFDRGATERFDLVIGADGLHSTVRRLAFGPEDRFLHFHGHYFAFADADPALGEDRWVTMFNRPGRMAGVYRSGNHPQAKAYFIFRSAPLVYDYRDVDQHRRIVRDAFADDRGWHVPALLDAATADPGFYFDSLSQVRLPAWSTGRIGLVGDAAYCASPASGAGAELAVVGSYRLAAELARADGDHAAAFARYQAAHTPLVRRRHRIGPNVRMMVPKTRAGSRVRDTLARLPFLTALGALEGAGEPLSPGIEVPAGRS
ncbi:FAD-dependent monooxygenase [Hamadaea tsunoensis]|uniref:FAD-dependent monooxygenase n=1 Tax=Hamadaea tsunoensis TaxID=53368 RepID=UPI0003FC7941|nr:FAD-dependent monooxygenase [Hamadaea tsunoensis]